VNFFKKYLKYSIHQHFEKDTEITAISQEESTFDTYTMKDLIQLKYVCG
jgi:hypothetical protein